MAKKKDEQLVQEEELRNNYNSILTNLTVPIETTSNLDALRPNIPGIGSMDFMGTKQICLDQASDMIDYLIDFYLNTALKDDPYIRKRMDDDKDQIADSLLQVKVSEHAIIKLLEKIDEGDLQPRNFEVLGSLMKSKTEILKHYEALKTNIENNYKGLKSDYDKKLASDGVIESPLQTAGKGQKDILQKLLNKMDLDAELYSDDKPVLPPGVKLATDISYVEDEE